MYSFSRYWLIECSNTLAESRLLAKSFAQTTQPPPRFLHVPAFLGIITHILVVSNLSNLHFSMGCWGPRVTTKNAQTLSLSRHVTCWEGFLIGIPIHLALIDTNKNILMRHSWGLVSKFANPIGSMYGIHSLDLPKACIVSMVRAAHIPFLRFKQHPLEYAGFNLNL